MFYLDPKTLKRYRIGTPFVYDGITYTSTGASHNTFMSLGFQQVLPEPQPDSRFYVVNHPCNPDGSWSYSERDLAQTQESFCDQQVTSANSNLKSTDYLYARAAEATRSMTEDEPVLSPINLITKTNKVTGQTKRRMILDCKSFGVSASTRRSFRGIVHRFINLVYDTCDLGADLAWLEIFL